MWDGRRGFGHILALRGGEAVVELANEHGVAAVALTNAGHIGRIGAYVSQAEDGSITLDPMPDLPAELAGVQQGDVTLVHAPVVVQVERAAAGMAAVRQQHASGHRIGDR